MVYELPDLRYQRKRRGKEELVKHMSEFKLDLRMSVGIWYFAPSGGRFHERYVPEKSIPERLELAKSLADYGITGIEAHYPAEISFDNVDLYRELEKATGISVVGIGFSHFFEKEFEFGSLSSPYPEVREKAVRIAVEGLRLVKEVGARFAISWPGIDGYTYSLGTVFPWMWDNFETSMAAAMDEVPGVRVALEPKPYEPAPNNIYRTTAEAILAAQRIERKLKHPENTRLLEQGRCLVGLNPEIGHVRMGYEDCSAAYSLVGMEGRLAHTHWNSQPLGNYDQDLNVGVVEWQQAEALMYVLQMMGYKEYFGIDINPERMPVETAIKINTKVMRIMRDRVMSLPHDRIVECYLDPRRHRGELELILAEAIKK